MSTSCISEPVLQGCSFLEYSNFHLAVADQDNTRSCNLHTAQNVSPIHVGVEELWSRVKLKHTWQCDFCAGNHSYCRRDVLYSTSCRLPVRTNLEHPFYLMWMQIWMVQAVRAELA